MPKHPEFSMREVLLDVINNQSSDTGGSLQQRTTLKRAAEILGISMHGGHSEAEQALLTEWHELFRTGRDLCQNCHALCHANALPRGD